MLEEIFDEPGVCHGKATLSVGQSKRLRSERVRQRRRERLKFFNDIVHNLRFNYVCCSMGKGTRV